MMKAITNVTNKKKCWRKYHKNIESIINIAESITNKPHTRHAPCSKIGLLSENSVEFSFVEFLTNILQLNSI